MAPRGRLKADSKAVEKVLDRLRARPLIKRILDRIERESSPRLHYHNIKHTTDVLREVVYFSVVDQLTVAEQELLAIAAAYHDAGYLVQFKDNEPVGAKMAREAMLEEGTFSEEQIKLVEQMILDTTLVETPQGPKQIPHTDLSRYLLDADLSNLGREDFFERGELQRQEMETDRESFNQRTYDLLLSHDWYTETAKDLRQATKAKNIERTKKLLSRNGAGE